MGLTSLALVLLLAAPPDETFSQVMKRLRREGNVELATKLEKQLEYERSRRVERRGDRILFGRVLRDEKDKGSLESLYSPVREVGDGYVMGCIGDPTRPVELRLEGYEVVSVLPQRGDPADVLSFKTVRLPRLKDADTARVSAKLVTEGDPLKFVEVTWTLAGSNNFPGNGSGGYRGSQHRRDVGVDGSVDLRGLMPTSYFVDFRCAGCISTWRNVDLKKGESLDLGTIVLETARRFRITWILGKDSTFSKAEQNSTDLLADEPFRPDPEPEYGFTFLIRQKEGKPWLRVVYQPARVVDLGPGSLDQLRRRDLSNEPLKPSRNEQPLIAGNVYLMDHTSLKNWVLFTVQPL